MRWLLISKQHHPSHGGIGTYVQRFCRAVRAHGWHVELVTQPGDDWPLCAHVHDVRALDMEPEFESRVGGLRRMHRVRPYRYALWSKAVAERLLTIRGEFDAIEFVDCQAEGFAVLGCRAVRERFKSAAFIVHAHTPMFLEEQINGADESLFGRSIYHDWERRAIRRADGVIVTSEVLARALTVSDGEFPSPQANSARTNHHRQARERAGVNVPGGPRKPTIIPYPIDEDRKPSTAKREERILLIGTVQPRKGVEVWVKSLDDVLRQRPRATALLIGSDTSTAPDGRSMAARIQKSLDPQVMDRFQWIGSLPHERTRELIATSALVVVPSVLESFSFAAAEALLAGTPVIVSTQTGIAEHVTSLPRVDYRDTDEWTRSQIAVLTDPNAARATAMRCRGEMLQSCAPSRVLAMREAMVCEVATRGANNQRTDATGTDSRLDSLVEMARFIADVDADEATAVRGDRRTTALSSSERS